jgi:DNA repair protein RecO (recombination protein O)
MATIFATQGFIMAKRDFGEADRFYLIATRDFGVSEFFAKGVRKNSAKLKSGLELFNLSEIEFVSGKQNKTLTDVRILDSFPEIKKNQEKLKIVFEISEIFANLIKGETPESSFWNFLEEFFNLLKKTKAKDLNFLLFKYYFIWNLLRLLGYGVEIQRCVVCQRQNLKPPFYFAIQEGGILCQNCSLEFQNSVKISENLLKILRLILKKEWLILARLKYPRTELPLIDSLTQQFLKSIL